MNSYISEHEFKTDENNKVIAAVYPINTHLIKENNNRMILGGSAVTGLSRFDKLGIPAGLYLEPAFFNIHNNEPASFKNKVNDQIIGDDLFDNLLGNITLNRIIISPFSY
jgi:hypothetical protein